MGHQILVIFSALLIDILAFTAILPLLPRILDHYKQNDTDSLCSTFISFVNSYKELIGAEDERFDIVLFGGLVGSIYSILQALVAPYIGKLSDKYGRKPVLMASMLGNILSSLIWLKSQNFNHFLISRVVAGLSEGNVQLSIAMITDLTSKESRSRGLALVGIAFSIGFTFGPGMSAYVASKEPVYENVFANASLFSLIMLILETVFLFFALEETRLAVSDKSKESPKNTHFQQNSLAFIHFMFLLIFSGMEFTVTFLTFERFQFTSIQQGKLLGTIGIIAAALQGGFVRRYGNKIGDAKIAFLGICSSAIGYLIIGIANTTQQLYVGAVFLAFTSATVVTCLTSLASKFDKSGHSLGLFRRYGQLGRAIGPILACSSYWFFGAKRVYMASFLATFMISYFFSLQIPFKKIKASKLQ
eukprot:NODE_1059_length_1622_cov_0.196323.p1 type:complete len:417 gc:universal NODE_1059_length_1622_cov_0.196323:1463-213(-)